MSEVFPSSKISGTEIKIERPVNNTGSERVVQKTPEGESLLKLSNPDMFTSAVAGNKATDPFLKTNGKPREFTDITDKLAAIYGEKEKDLKDRLSDTFKRAFPVFYSATGPVDASMGQKQHQREKKLKDHDEENKKRKENKEEKKGLSLLQIINYKLLEIKGEILNLSNKIKAKFEETHENLKTGFYGELIKVKEMVAGTLDRIDSVISSKKAQTNYETPEDLFKE